MAVSAGVVGDDLVAGGRRACERRPARREAARAVPRSQSDVEVAVRDSRRIAGRVEDGGGGGGTAGGVSHARASMQNLAHVLSTDYRYGRSERTVMKAISRALLAGALLLAGCATVANLIQLQPPDFAVAAGRRSELRLLGPSRERPLGGAAIRIWSHVTNPNPFGLTLTTVEGDLLLEGARAAAVNLPLGLPLRANQDTVIPVDFAVSFAEVPGLADAAVRFLTERTVGYRLDGRFGVDAGPFGRPTFGPTTLLQGELDVRR
ncbi:MAG TPA: LEA type 2 family protein [Longimicrobiales bacterium]